MDLFNWALGIMYGASAVTTSILIAQALKTSPKQWILANAKKQYLILFMLLVLFTVLTVSFQNFTHSFDGPIMWWRFLLISSITTVSAFWARHIKVVRDEIEDVIQ